MSYFDAATRMMDSIRDSSRAALPNVAKALIISKGTEYIRGLLKNPEINVGDILGIDSSVIEKNKIENFKNYFKDFARANLFEVLFFTEYDNQFLQKACKSVDVPGITFRDSSVDGIKHINGYDLDSINMTFNLDSEGKILEMLTKWSEKIFDRKTKTFGFKDDYARPIIIRLMQRSGLTFANILIEDAYPLNISPISMSWDSTDTITEISVSMNFDMFTIDFIY